MLAGLHNDGVASSRATISVSDSISLTPGVFDDPKVIGSVAYGFSLNKKFILQPKVQLFKREPIFYVTKDDSTLPFPYWGFPMWFRAMTLDFPVNLQFRLHRNITLSAGPAVQVMFFKKDKGVEGYLIEENRSGGLEVFYAINESFKTFNWSTNYEVTFELKRVLLHVQYSVGHGNSIKVLKFTDRSRVVPLKINRIALSVGYLIIPKKRIQSPNNP